MVKPRELRVVFTGGATGGHIYPNLAVAEALRELCQQQKINLKLYYFGHPEKLEARLLQSKEALDELGQAYGDYIDFVGIRGQSLPGKKLLNYPRWIINFLIQMNKARHFLLSKKIDVVFGTGGYIAAPVFTAAKITATKYIIHNLDAHLGLANKVFVPGAEKVTLAFPIQKLLGSGDHIELVGNPVSKKFFASKTQAGNEQSLLCNVREQGLGIPSNQSWSVVNEDREGDKLSVSEANYKNSSSSVASGRCATSSLHLLVTGGSQGAEGLNDLVGNLLPRLQALSVTTKLHIRHVTGSANYASHLRKYLADDENKFKGEDFSYEIVAYAYNMPELCNWADIAICRSGAMTIAEMAASKVVPIFLPLPWAANDHQSKNASYLVDAGAAYSFDQSSLGTEEKVFAAIADLVNDADLLARMRERLETFASEDSATKLAQMIVGASL